MNILEWEILIVEDNVDHAFLARFSLEKAGYKKLSIVNDGKQCRNIVQEKKFDIIMLDYNLPEEDGLSLLYSLKTEMKIEAAIVFVTGHEHAAVAVAAIKAGAFEYVIKSGSYVEVLPNIVKRVGHKYKMFLAQKQAEKEAFRRSQELLVLNSISAVLNKSLILNDILADAVNIISTTLGLDTVAVYLQEADTLQCRFAVGGINIGDKLDDCPICLHATMYELYSTESNQTSWLQKKLHPLNLKSGIATPLIYKENLHGVLICGSTIADFFTGRKINLFSSIANQMAIAIENASLYQTTDRMKNNFEGVLNSSLDQIVSIDSHGKISFFNDEFQRVHKDRGNLIGAHFLDFVHETCRDAVQAKFDQISSEKGRTYEAKMQLPDGRTLQCIISQANMKGRDELVLLIKDFSPVLKLYNQLIQSEKLSALGQMIAGAAHELNNPLAGIMGYGQLILEENESETTRNDIQVILKETRRCQKIIKNLLAFSGKDGDSQSIVDLNEVVTRVIDLQSFHLRKDEILLERYFQPDLPKLSGETRQLEQVVLHLIKNAHDALKCSGKSLRILRVETRVTRENAYIIVEDNGSGIEDSMKNRIFEPFFTTKEVGCGAGLGLSLSYGIIQAHQGKMFVDSQPGIGTKIVIRLPRQGEYDGHQADKIMLGRYASARG